MIVERIKDLSKFGEIYAGDKNERKLVEYIKKFFDKTDEINIFPLQVLNYRETHEIIGKEKINADYLPYSPSIDFEGKIIKNFNECNENTAILIQINNLYEINKYYRLGVIYRCGAIVFITDKRRKFVIKTLPYLNLYPNPPPPVPAVVLPQNELSKLENNISIKAEINIRESTGYVLEAVKNSKREKKIYITSHHDHFFYGERDNLLGVSLLPEFASDTFELHLVSFTAEETGALGYSSFSWSYGSRQFINKYLKDIDNIILNINLDNVDPKNPIIKATPGVMSLFKDVGSPVISSAEIYSDGYSFTKVGIPSITLEGYSENYHSIDDVVDISEEDQLINLISRINKILKLENIQINLQEFRNEIFSESKYLPVNLKSMLINIIDNLDNDLYRQMLKLYGGILKLDETFAEVKLFHKLLGLNNLRGVTYLEGKPAIEIVASDREYIKELRRTFLQEYIDILYHISEKLL